MQALNTLDPLLTEHDVARIANISVASIRRWRLLRKGPKYLKIGAAVRYKPESVSAWLESRPSGGEHPQAEAYSMSATAKPEERNRRGGQGEAR